MRVTDSLPIKHFKKNTFGLVDQAIRGDIPGRIRYDGTIWFARPYAPGLDLTFCEGESVEIHARQGNTLLILPHKNHLI